MAPVRALALALCFATAPGVTAQDRELTPEQSAALLVYKEGLAHHKAGRLEKALPLFVRAFEILDHPAIRFYLGRTYAELDRCPEGLEHLLAVAGALGDDADGQRAEGIRLRLASTCAIEVASVELTTWQCANGHALLEQVDVDSLDKKGKKRLAKVAPPVLRCHAFFATDTEEGREAAAKYAEARAHLAEGRAKEALEAAGASLAAQPENKLGNLAAALAHAQLDRCDVALDALTLLTAKLGEGDLGAADEAARAGAEHQCRLVVALQHAEAFRCRDAQALLLPLNVQALDKAERQRVVALDADLIRCVEDFDTSSTPQQKAAALHAAAVAHLEAGEGEDALKDAEASVASADSWPGRYVQGRALAALGRCGDALPLLAGVAPNLRKADRALHREAQGGCQLAEARRRVEAEDCAAAQPLLEQLRGWTKGADETWRAEKVAWCEPRSTEFLTDTAVRKAAYKLFVGAREAAAAGEVDKALRRYAKALGLVDEPVIRRDVAALYLGRVECDEASEALVGIPEAQRQEADRSQLLACGPWAPAETLDAEGLEAYIAAVTQALRARSGDDPELALATLDMLAIAGESAAVRAAWIDEHYRWERCEAYVAEVAKAKVVVRALVQDSDERVATCEARLARIAEANKPPEPKEKPAQTTDAGPRSPATGPDTVAARSEADAGMSGREIAAWSLIGGGAAALGVGGYFLFDWLDQTGEANSATATFNDINSSPLTAANAWNRREDAADQAMTSSIVALSMGVVGVGAATAGVVLLLLDGGGDEAPADGESGVALTPVGGAGYVGLRGSF